MEVGNFSITSERVSMLKAGLSSILSAADNGVIYVEARVLARSVGRISSMHHVLGDRVRFYSRYLFLAIETSSWNSKVLNCRLKPLTRFGFGYLMSMNLMHRDGPLFQINQLVFRVLFARMLRVQVLVVSQV